MLNGTNLVHTKQYNLRIVHEVIRLAAPISRAEVARRTSLTGQTVSNLVRELLALGLVVESGRRREGRGAPSTTLVINPDGAYAIGLDLNRDHLTGVLVDLAGVVRQRASIDVEYPTPQEALDLMTAMAGDLLRRQRLPRDRVWGIGVGIPGPMHQAADGAGYVVNPTAFPGWHDIPLAAWLHDRLALPVFLENNATAAAVGERWYGAGRRHESFFYLFFGSGLGGGLVMQGRPYEGCTGNAGEIGYLPTSLTGGAASDGDASHVGLHFNLPRLFERLRAAGADASTPADLDRLLAAGHPAMLEWTETAADLLTGLVLAVEYLIDPEAIFYGGRLSDRVLQRLMEDVARRLPARRVTGKGTAPLHLLATAGADAAALGVATLPIYEFFAPGLQVLVKARRTSKGSAARRVLAGR